jgi:hypothetical protein
MSLLATIEEDMKAALRAGDKLELGALRMALAAVKNKQIDDRGALSDEAIQGLLEKMIKQGAEAKAQFEAGGRSELAAKEAAEIAVFERYLPKRLTDAEVDALIAEAIAATAAASAKDMGRVMAEIKQRATGRVDMAAVSSRVREALAAG